MGSELLAAGVPLVMCLAWFIGFIYLWYVHANK